MAHIPQDARYVDPPSEREVDEDRITEEAVWLVRHYGGCPSCKETVAEALADPEWDEWTDAHALSCDKLRERAIDALYGEDA